MKEFIKTSSGLSNVDNAKIKIYPSVDCAEAALANGCLAEGDVIATKFVDGAGDIVANIQTLADTVATISAEIPSGTNAIDNTLVNQSMLSEATGGAINVCCGSTCVCNISAGGNALVLDAVAFDGVTSLTNRVCTLENTTIPDLCTCVTCIQCDITCLQCDIADAECCISNIETVLDDPTSGLTSIVNELSTCKVDCTDYENCVECLAQCCDLPTYTLSGTTLTITL